MEQNNTFNFDTMAALEAGESVENINRYLAQQKNFDYDQAVADELKSKRDLILGQDPQIQIDDELLKKDINEDLLVYLTDGQFVRSENPMARGAAQAAFTDIPTFAAAFRGGQKGYQVGMALPIPHPLAKALAVGATTLGGAAIAAFPTAKLGDLAFTSIVDDAEVIPSQRAEKEAARTAVGMVGGLSAIPRLAAKESTESLAKYLKSNIDTMQRGPKKLLAQTGALPVRGAEAMARAIKQPMSPTTKAGKVGAGIAYSSAVGLPAAGTYFAEEVPIFRESADAPATMGERMLMEVGVSATPVVRIFSSLGTMGQNLYASAVRALSSEGRQAQAGQDLFDAITQLQTKYGLEGERFASQQAYYDELTRLLEEAPLNELVQEINKGLPTEGQLRLPELGLAEATKLPEIELIARGLRNSGDKLGREFGKESEQRYQDFLYFGRKLVNNILGQEPANPQLLNEVADIQEQLFVEALTQRLAVAKQVGEQVSSRVTPEDSMGAGGATLVAEIKRAKDEADRTGDMLYDAAKEGLQDLSIIPEQTFTEIQSLVQDGLTLTPKIRSILTEIQPNVPALERQLQLLERERLVQEENAFKLANKAEEFLVGRPEIRTNTLLGNTSTDLSRMGVPDISQLENLTDLLTTNPANALREAESLILAIQDPSVPKTEANRQAVAYLRKLLGVANAKMRLRDLDGQVEAARENLITAPPETTSVNRLVALKSELGKLARQEARKPGATGDPAVFQLSNVMDGLVNDLEQLTGELVEGGVVDPRYEQLMRANAFHRAKHDVFTRTFAGEAFVKGSSGALKIEPELYGERLLAGSPTQRKLQIEQVRDAVNWLYSPQFRELAQDVIPDEHFSELADLATNRIGTYQAAEQDVLRNFLRNKDLIDLDPQSPTYKQINQNAARKFVQDNEPLRQFFPAIFSDLEDAISGRIKVDELLAEEKRVDKILTETMPYLMRFQGVEDNPGSLIRNMLGAPEKGRRPPNVVKNFRGLITDINNSAIKNPEAARKAKEALSRSVLDEAWRYAGGADAKNPFDFQRFRAYLFTPFSGRGEGPSVATLLEEGGLVSPEQFKLFERVLTEADAITKILDNKGPMFEGELVDKGYLLSNILVRAGGAIGGNVLLNRIKPLIGNVPGASMSVAQTTADATAKLGLTMPKGKVKDLFFEAFRDAETAKKLLEKAPKTDAAKSRYLGTLPTILFTSGVRPIVQEESKPAPAEIPIAPATPAVEEPRVPEPLVQLPPLPMPAPQPAAPVPNPQLRQQYAALFPNDPTSEMIRGGIGSLG